MILQKFGMIRVPPGAISEGRVHGTMDGRGPYPSSHCFKGPEIHRKQLWAYLQSEAIPGLVIQSPNFWPGSGQKLLWMPNPCEEGREQNIPMTWLM